MFNKLRPGSTPVDQTHVAIRRERTACRLWVRPVGNRRPQGFTPRHGFTLVEMLVVIAIIGLLLGLMMPVIFSARNSARKVDCQMRLRQIGLAIANYMDSRGQSACYPDVGQMPSLAPGRPTLMSVLAPYVEDAKPVFACPMDTEYYPREGISYEYRSLQFAGKTRQQALASPFNNNRMRPSEEVILMNDFDPFHGSANQDGARNVVYADGHVESL
ncbi:MAG: type II secretion system GspH family protein [Planctomycetes bacterium]|nr:type II secretion system GspH family protein [Planctomycetota bacterium]